MIQESWIQPRSLVYPFPIHDREHLTYTNNENGAYKHNSMEKRQPSSSRYDDFSLLQIDLDLEKKHPNHGKERGLRV
jgi:hypothetical protein